MNKTALLQLTLTKGIGDVAIKHVLDFMKAHGLTYEVLEQSPDAVLSGAGIRSDIARRFPETRFQAYSLAENLSEHGIEILSETDADYPLYLKQTLGAGCPPVLFAKGNLSVLNQKGVGFCGSRKASQKGLDITAACARQLSEKQIAVVSGYASGVDLTAHQTTLASGGVTVFVLAEGILKMSVKAQIRDYLSDKNHVFISQFSPRLPWTAGNAMKRNSTIIGLSRAMILIESGRTGGTFAAGESALKAHCPLFVVDFAQPEISAEANRYFIAKGGYPVRGKNGVPNLRRVLQAVTLDNGHFQETGNEQLRIAL